MCAVLVAGGPRAAAAVAVAAVHPPTASLQRLTEAELGSYHEIDHQGPGTYVFGYDVDDPETGNSQFRQEERHPNGTVTGSYGLVLPDGSIQIVHYTADHLGYRARIETKKPEARYRPAAPTTYGVPEAQATAYAAPAQHPAYAAPAQPSAYAAPAQPSAYAAPAQPSAYAAPAQPSTYSAPAQPYAYAAAAFRTQPPRPSRVDVPPPAAAEYEPVFWLPAPAAAPPFSVNYV